MSEIDELKATIEHLEQRIRQLEQQPGKPPIGTSYPMTTHANTRLGFHITGPWGQGVTEQPRLQEDQ